MVDVFISYPRKERARVEPIKRALEARRLSVFFDIQGIDSRGPFPDIIDQNLRASKAVLCCFAPLYFSSDWCKREGRSGVRRRIAVAIRIREFAPDAPPVDFDDINYRDMAQWRDAPEHEGWRLALIELGALVGWDLLHSWTNAEWPPEDATPAVIDQPVNSPDPTPSPAAEDFAEVERRSPLSIPAYEIIIRHWPRAPERDVAQARVDALSAWERLDKASVEDIDDFDCPLGFHALASVVAEARAEALAQRRRRIAAEIEQAEKTAERDRLLATPLAVFRDTLRSGGQGPEMVVIPEGAFMMGSPADEPQRMDNEGPQHLVRIANRFALGKYAVTFEEYDAYCAASGAEKPDDAGWGRAWQPVIHVSWDDAQGYCRWLSDATGADYRLPSEAEWEYACRGQRSAEAPSTPFWWGREITPDQANYNGDYTYQGGGRKGVYRKKTVAVDFGEFTANPFGLHQMHGNVSEWCQDDWNESYQGAPADSSAWAAGGTPIAVLRGGSWYSYAFRLRSANRFRFQRDGRFRDLGFRVARTIIPR